MTPNDIPTKCFAGQWIQTNNGIGMPDHQLLRIGYLFESVCITRWSLYR